MHSEQLARILRACQSDAIVKDGILDQPAAHLGGRLKLEPSGAAGTLIDPLTGEGNRILGIAARNPNKSQSYILSFDLKAREAYPDATNMMVRAEIQWGSPKGKGRAIIDVKHGTRVTLEGTSLNVNVFLVFDNSLIAAANNDGPETDVYASVGVGSVGKAPSLTYSERPENLLAAGTQVFPVPFYAREVEIQATTDPLAAIPNVFSADLISSPTILVGARVISRHTGIDTRFTIPNGAAGLLITNNGPLASVVAPIFHLTL